MLRKRMEGRAELPLTLTGLVPVGKTGPVLRVEVVHSLEQVPMDRVVGRQPPQRLEGIPETVVGEARSRHQIHQVCSLPASVEEAGAALFAFHRLKRPCQGIKERLGAKRVREDGTEARRVFVVTVEGVLGPRWPPR